jgi:hypothetical protein
MRMDMAAPLGYFALEFCGSVQDRHMLIFLLLNIDSGSTCGSLARLGQLIAALAACHREIKSSIAFAFS